MSELCVGQLPGRKRPAMWIEGDGVIRPLAYFCGDEEFAEFKELIGDRGLVQAPSGRGE